MEKYNIDFLQPSDINALLQLQQDNLKRNLDAQTIEHQGFVTFVYDLPSMQRMMASAPQIVAKDGSLLIGYALSATIEMGQSLHFMQPLLERCKMLTYDNKPLADSRYYIMGQICIRDGYRGLGLFDALYEGHKRYLSPHYDYIITEISEENKRSLTAHRRVGFKTIHEYFDDVSQEHWHLVLWDFK